jgi:hypothetical protein
LYERLTVSTDRIFRQGSLYAELALRFAQTDAGASTIFCDELDAGLFEGVRYCEHGIL